MSGTLHVRHQSRALFTALMLLGAGVMLVLLGFATQSEEMRKERGFVPFVSVLVAFGLLVMVCGLIEVWRHWVEVDSQRIVKHGAFRLKEIRWEDVQSAVWLAGSIVLESPSHKVELAFKNYARDDLQALIAAIRGALPADVQRDDARLSSGVVLWAPSKRS